MAITRIRRAEAENATAIAAMTAAMSAEEGLPPPVFNDQTLTCDGVGRDRIFSVFIAEQDGAVVGHIATTTGFDFQEGAPVFWICDLYAKPDNRRRGKDLSGAIPKRLAYREAALKL